MKQNVLSNMQKITKELGRVKGEYKDFENELIHQNKLEKALEVTEITNDLETIEKILTTLTEKFSPILNQVDFKVGKGRPKKITLEELPLINDLNILVEKETNNIKNDIVDIPKRKRGRPKKNTNPSNLQYQNQSNKLYKVPVQMTLLNEIYEINQNWREVYLYTLEKMIELHGDVVKQFPNNSKLQGRKMIYFTYDNNVPMISKQQLSNGMYVNLNLSSTAIVKNCYRVLKACGYEENVLTIKVKYIDKREKVNRKNL